MDISNLPKSLWHAEASVVTFKVIIGHNSRTECAKESVKTSSDAEDSNALFEVCCAYLRHHCDVFFGKIRFPRSQKYRGFYTKSHGAETKHVGNKVFV